MADGMTLTIGGDLRVYRLGFGAMRITGPGIWDVSQEAQSRSYQT